MKISKVLNPHLDVLHLHLVQLLLVLSAVAVDQLLPLRGRRHVMSVLVGRGRQRAVGHLRVVALVGEVAETFVLQTQTSV